MCEENNKKVGINIALTSESNITIDSPDFKSMSQQLETSAKTINILTEKLERLLSNPTSFGKEVKSARKAGVGDWFFTKERHDCVDIFPKKYLHKVVYRTFEDGVIKLKTYRYMEWEESYRLKEEHILYLWEITKERVRVTGTELDEEAIDAGWETLKLTQYTLHSFNELPVYPDLIDIADSITTYQKMATKNDPDFGFLNSFLAKDYNLANACSITYIGKPEHFEYYDYTPTKDKYVYWDSLNKKLLLLTDKEAVKAMKKRFKESKIKKTRKKNNSKGISSSVLIGFLAGATIISIVLLGVCGIFGVI